MTSCCPEEKDSFPSSCTCQKAPAGLKEVKKLCGFEVVWGPVHAKHIKEFLDKQMKATANMRRVTFTLRERVELIPVELGHMGKPTLYLVRHCFCCQVWVKVFFRSAAPYHGVQRPCWPTSWRL